MTIHDCDTTLIDRKMFLMQTLDKGWNMRSI